MPTGGPRSEKTSNSTSVPACSASFIKSSDKKRTPLNLLPTPELPNERIHLDLFGPLKTSEKHNK